MTSIQDQAIPAHHGPEIGVRFLSGAEAVREIYGAGAEVTEHQHEWPSLILPILGGFTSVYNGRTTWATGPCALLHPRGGPHAASIGSEGLEALTIHFDPAWLRRTNFEPSIDRHVFAIGGSAAFVARRLVRLWLDEATSDLTLAKATADLLGCAFAGTRSVRPNWIDRVQDAVQQGPVRSTFQLAREFGLHPAWVAQVYRKVTGEGIPDTRRRRRVAYASNLLRWTDAALAEIAVAAGFCDQSHMNRAFRAIVGRTPFQVRSEMRKFAGAPTPRMSVQECGLQKDWTESRVRGTVSSM